MDTTKISRWIKFGAIILALGAALISTFVPDIPGKTDLMQRTANTPPTQNQDANIQASPESLIIRGTAATDLKEVTPTPSNVIQSPLTITGLARGTMFFEGSFPIILVDGNGETVDQGLAEATEDWMTEDFVPFTAKLSWTEIPSTETGSLIFKRDNPSGLPEHDREAYMTVKFSKDAPPPQDGDIVD